jgi:hypothetical protein
MKLFFSSCLVITSLVCQAQLSFIHLPNDSIVRKSKLDSIEYLNINLKNISTNNIALQWTLISKALPPNWVFYINDNYASYPSSAASAIMTAIVPNGIANLDIAIEAKVNNGIAVLTFAVNDTANKMLKDTLSYILIVNSTSINTVDASKLSIIYPNPTTNELVLQPYNNVFKSVEVLNSNGQKLEVAIQHFNNNIRLSMADLPAAIYFLKIEEINGEIYFKKIMKQ